MNQATLLFLIDGDKILLAMKKRGFGADRWNGVGGKPEPGETEEMASQWFSIPDIPYNQMWSDDQFWLPLVIKGKYVNADFHFDENEQLLKHSVKTD